MSHLDDDFRDLAFELARQIKQEIDKMKERTISTIVYIEEETKRKITRDISSLETRIVQNAEFELNRKISDRINEINQNILLAKTMYIEKFISELKTKIVAMILKHPEKYFQFLSKKLLEFGKIFRDGGKIRLNKQDSELLKKFNTNFLYDKTKFDLDPIYADIVAGFQIYSNDLKYTIDYSVDSMLEKQKNEISKLFMKIFPVFEVNVPDSIDIYRQQKTPIKEEGRGQ